MSTKQKIALALLALAAVIAGIVILAWPAFVNPYFDECISQNLAPVCYKYQVPTWEVFVYFLFH